MNRTTAAAVALIVAPLLFCRTAAAETQCVLLHDGIEYRAFLPDARRFVYVDVKVLSGMYPSVFVIADKNYEAANVKITPSDPLNQWWIDRSRPFLFSSDKVQIRWAENHTFDFVTDWFSDRPASENAQAFRGLEKADGHFVGTGAADTNTFAFQTRLEMNGFSGDMFEVKLPAVTYEGVTVAPPIVRFDRQDHAFTAKC